MIFRIMGALVLCEAVMLALCIGVSAWYGEDDLNSFILTTLITLLAGGALLVTGWKAERSLSKRDGILIVGSSWLVVSLFGMLPFYISGYVPGLANAFFEAISGFTSTGSTILDDIESLPHALLFWRSFTQWIGGLGIVFFTIAVLPIFGVGGIQLFAAEASGAAKEKVHPRIGVTAKWIWSIYLGMTVLVFGLLLLGGMDVFDGLCHAFTTTSTGGFSTKQSSIGYYQSAYIEYVIAFFMTASGVNFTLLLLFVNRKFKKFFSNTELKWYLISIAAFTFIIFIGIYQTQNIGIEEAFRVSFFQVASIHTSTGFATADYMTWQPVLWAILSSLMFIGACAGSTSGGIKCIRMIVLTKVARNEMKHLVHPNAVLPVRINKQVIPPSMLTSTLAFIFVYMATIVLGVIIMLALGVDFLESVGTVISSVSNMGPGLGMTGPAYSWNALPDAAKWLCSFLMLLGRLELFTILVLFSPEFWKRR